MLCFENDCPGDMKRDVMSHKSDLLLILTGFGSQFDTTNLLEFLSQIGEYCD
ncbi:MAG: hypothetical protein ACJAV7_002241 [Flavobacteriales bacterium]|jgi:hypothetical protein